MKSHKDVKILSRFRLGCEKWEIQSQTKLENSISAVIYRKMR